MGIYNESQTIFIAHNNPYSLPLIRQLLEHSVDGLCTAECSETCGAECIRENCFSFLPQGYACSTCVTFSSLVAGN